MRILTSPRRRGTEILDDPHVNDTARLRSLRDVVRCNVLFGGRRALLRELDAVLALTTEATLLDVGTGLGDLPHAARVRAERRGSTLTIVGLDGAPVLAAAARANVDYTVCGEALALPFADGAVDVVTCSQLLHHFDDDAAVRLVCEMARVARRAVVVSDLRRSRLAAAGLWLAAWPLHFDGITRHDGPLSVMRGFTARELRTLVQRATGASVTVRRRLGWRLTLRIPAARTPAIVHRGSALPTRASQQTTRGNPVRLGPLGPLGPLPVDRRFTMVDERVVRAPPDVIFALARDVERWPEHLAHYRFVRVHARPSCHPTVEMSAVRPFGPLRWPTWWLSEMEVHPPGSPSGPAIRFRHVRGVTRGMEVEWRFTRAGNGTRVRIVHVWDGPTWPPRLGATTGGIIGSVFVHGIASRTLAGLGAVAERLPSDTVKRE